jgi:hypothetical protein
MQTQICGRKKRTTCKRSMVEQRRRAIIFVEYKHQIWKISMAMQRRKNLNMGEED